MSAVKQKHIGPLLPAKHNSEGGRQYAFYSSSQNTFELKCDANHHRGHPLTLQVGSLGSVWSLTPPCLTKVKRTTVVQQYFSPLFFKVEPIDRPHKQSCGCTQKFTLIIKMKTTEQKYAISFPFANILSHQQNVCINTVTVFPL